MVRWYRSIKEERHHLEKFSAEREEHAKVATVLWQDDDVQCLSRLSHTSLTIVVNNVPFLKIRTGRTKSF